MANELELLELDQLEIDWLYSRGGRLKKDVLIDEKGKKYIIMQNGRSGECRVYIPSIQELRRERQIKNNK